MTLNSKLEYNSCLIDFELASYKCNDWPNINGIIIEEHDTQKNLKNLKKI